ncbi:MAG: hypothetical protein WCF54_12960 [Terracidiphilus sp.]
MKLSELDWLFIVATLLGNSFLFAVLMIRRRWKSFSVFSAFMGFEAGMNPILYVLYLYGSNGLYGKFYWSCVLIEFLFQLAIIWEIARIVMRPTGTWLHDARKQFILAGGVGLLLAAVFAWVLNPPASNLRVGLETGSSFFTSLVVCELFVVMLLTAKRLGLGFRNHVFALVIGWSGWVMTAMMVDMLHGYYGVQFHYSDLENVRKVAYLAALLYWIVQFWMEEPARQELPEELRAYILALHQRVDKDIDKLNARR